MQEYSGLIHESGIDYIQFDATIPAVILIAEKSTKNLRKIIKQLFMFWEVLQGSNNFHFGAFNGKFKFFEVPLLELEINDHLTQDNKLYLSL